MFLGPFFKLSQIYELRTLNIFFISIIDSSLKYFYKSIEKCYAFTTQTTMFVI